jgi:hypothetical protein
MFNELIPVHNSSCHVLQFKRRKREKQSATKCHQVYIGFLCMLLQSGVYTQNARLMVNECNGDFSPTMTGLRPDLRYALSLGYSR